MEHLVYISLTIHNCGVWKPKNRTILWRCNVCHYGTVKYIFGFFNVSTKSKIAHRLIVNGRKFEVTLFFCLYTICFITCTAVFIFEWSDTSKKWKQKGSSTHLQYTSVQNMKTSSPISASLFDHGMQSKLFIRTPCLLYMHIRVMTRRYYLFW